MTRHEGRYIKWLHWSLYKFNLFYFTNVLVVRCELVKQWYAFDTYFLKQLTV